MSRDIGHGPDPRQGAIPVVNALREIRPATLRGRGVRATSDQERSPTVLDETVARTSKGRRSMETWPMWALKTVVSCTVRLRL